MPADAVPPGAVPPYPVTIRYFAGARVAAGIAEETLTLPPDGCSVAELIPMLEERHGERLAKVLGAASLLVDGVACRDRDAPLPANSTVDILPPFAGG